MNTGAAGAGLSATIAGLDILLTDFGCTGTESNLSSCSNNSLAACAGQVVAAVGCQGILTCVTM